MQLFLNVMRLKKMWVRAVDSCYFVFDSLYDQYKTEEMNHKVVSEDPDMLKYCLEI